MKDICYHCKHYSEHNDQCDLSFYSSSGGKTLSMCVYDDSLQDLFLEGRKTLEIRQKNTEIINLRNERDQLKKIVEFMRREKTSKKDVKL